MQSFIQKHIQEHQHTIERLLPVLPVLAEAAEAMIQALKCGKTIFFLGNGGSAADAQHMAAELIWRFRLERRALPAIALTTDTSILTAVGNDSDFSAVYSRQIEALCREGDVVVALSTSGNSVNIIKAVEKARECGALVIGMTGESGGLLKSKSDICCCVPSKMTPRIQEAHILIGHSWCDAIDEAFAKN